MVAVVRLGNLFSLGLVYFLCLTCFSELLRRLITQKDELVEEVDTLRETLRVGWKKSS